MFRRFALDFPVGKLANRIVISRSISTHAWEGKEVYKKGSDQQKEMIRLFYMGAKLLGFDGAGAVHGFICGSPPHNHNLGGVGRKWITGYFEDAQGRRLLYEGADGVVYSKVHIFTDVEERIPVEEKPKRIFTEDGAVNYIPK